MIKSKIDSDFQFWDFINGMHEIPLTQMLCLRECLFATNTIIPYFLQWKTTFILHVVIFIVKYATTNMNFYYKLFFLLK